MPKAISLALTVVIGSPEDIVGQVRRGRCRDHAPLHQRARRSAGEHCCPGAQHGGREDEAVETDRDVSDNSSHARADPIRRPNSSLTHETCGKCELDSTTREAARRTYSGRSPPSTSQAHMHRSKGMASLVPGMAR